MTSFFLGNLLLIALLTAVLMGWVLLHWPKAWLLVVVRLTRGRWVLRWLQLVGLGAFSRQRVMSWWLWDVKAEKVYLAAKELSVFGYDSDWVEVSREHFFGIFDIEDIQRLDKAVNQFIQGEDQFAFECRLVTPAGTKRWVQLSGQMLWRDTKCNAQLVLGRIEDISERKIHVGTIAAINDQLQERIEDQALKIQLTEQTANELQLRLQQVLNTVPVALCWKNVSGAYLGCNQKFAKLVGESDAKNVEGKTDFELFSLDQAERIVAEDEKLISGVSDSLEQHQQFKDNKGQLVSLDCHAVTLRDRRDLVVGTLWTFQDTSVRQRMEVFAQKERQLMQEILDGSNAMITIVDRHYCFLRINRCFQSTLGLSAKNVVGKHVKEVIKGPKGDLVVSICDQIVATGMPVSEEYSVPTERGGRRTFIANVTPVFDENGEVDKIVTVSTDVTELKLTQIELEVSRNKAEQAASVKSRFLANMSHEIRTPMNAILGLSQLALTTNLDARQEDYISKIHFSAQNLLGIVNDILDFSKIEAGKLALEEKAFDLRVLLNNLCSIFEMKAKSQGLSFTRKLAPNTPPFICADALRLHQILVNLLGNAIKFTHQGGVALEVGMRVDMGARQILRFTVIDTGVGLSETQISQLFEAFEQADAGVSRQYGGTGLGLTISRRLVEMMGGEIVVTSEVGKGSRFEFTVNVGSASPADVLELTAGHAPVEVPDFQGAKILLVEDNSVNRQVAQEILAPFNLTIVSAVNGAEAVDLVLNNNFSLVLMDIQMPVMDGYTATRKIREYYSSEQLPILGLTANAMAEDRQAGESAGMNAHIAKPIDTRQLVSELTRFLCVVNKTPVKAVADSADLLPNPAVEANINFSEFLPSLDVEDGLKRLRGRRDRYLELLQSFISQFKAGGKQSVALMEQHAFSDAKALAHQVRGVAGNLSAKRVFTESQRLEELIEKGLDQVDVGQVREQGDALQAALDELVELVDKLAIVLTN